MGSTKPKRFKRKASKKQNVWAYMRRNRTFRVGDIMMLLELTQRYLKPILWHLEKAGYLTLTQDSGEYRDRIYTLVRDTGVKSPSIINGEVFDYNTGKFHSASPKNMARHNLLKTLEALEHTIMTKHEMAEGAGMSRESGASKLVFQELELKGVIARTNPISRRDNKMLFTVNTEKRDALIAALQADG